MTRKMISHYRILEKLGEGGMGVVYKAEDTRLERTVAIKFLPDRIGTSDRERERFRIEAKAAGALNHPNIATVHAIDEVDGQVFIVMEYIEGRELRELVQENLPEVLDLQTVMGYAVQIAEGLQAAHKKGIVHRDIKSSNIMVTEEGQVKIMDFGLAKVRGKAQVTQAGTTLGTAAYMSPEQARGEEVDQRADIWSFGAILYELLTGNVPFKGDYEQAVIYSILNEEPEPITSARSETSELLQRVISKALAKDPNDRYGGVGEILAELAPLAGSRVRPISAVPHSRASQRLRKRWRLLAPVGVASILAAIWLVSRFGSEQTVESGRDMTSAIAVLPFSVRGGEEIAYLKEGMVDLLSTKLDGVGELTSVDPNALLGYLGNHTKGAIDLDTADKVAKHFHAGRYILGSVVKAGDRIQLHASLYSVGNTRPEIKEEAIAENESELLAAIDELAQRLISGQFVTSREQLTSLAVLTTHSFAAVKAYLEGERQLRAGRFSDAVEALQTAVTHDSTFALAWYRLSRAAGWEVRREIVRTASRRAFELSEKLPERVRKLMQAQHAFTVGRPAEAEGLYRSVLAKDPDDLTALQELGDLLFHYNSYFGRPASESRPFFERALLYDPNNSEAVYHLVDMAAQDRRLAEQDSLVVRYKHFGNALKRLGWKTLQVLQRGSEEDKEQLYAEISKADSWTKLQLTAGTTSIIQDIPAAMRMAETMFDPSVSPTRQRWASLSLMLGEAARGRVKAAGKRAGRLEKDFSGDALVHRAWLNTVPFYLPAVSNLRRLRTEVANWDTTANPLHSTALSETLTLEGQLGTVKSFLTGLLDHYLQDTLGTVTRIRSLRRRGELGFQLAITLQALQWRQEGQFERALELLDTVPFQRNWLDAWESPFTSQILVRYLRADLYRALGRDAEALRWYHSLHDGYFSWSVSYLGPSYLREAEIYEQLGDTQRALQYYDRFIDLWVDSDPEFRPMLEDAKARRKELLQAMATEPGERSTPMQ